MGRELTAGCALLRRLNAPKHWMLDKLGGIFVSGGGMRLPCLHVALCGPRWPPGQHDTTRMHTKTRVGGSEVAGRPGAGAQPLAASAPISRARAAHVGQQSGRSIRQPCAAPGRLAVARSRRAQQLAPCCAPSCAGPQAVPWPAQAARVPAPGPGAAQPAQVRRGEGRSGMHVSCMRCDRMRLAGCDPARWHLPQRRPGCTSRQHTSAAVASCLTLEACKQEAPPADVCCCANSRWASRSCRNAGRCGERASSLLPPCCDCAGMP